MEAKSSAVTSSSPERSRSSGCILEAWLASKRFSTGPSLSVNSKHLVRQQAQLQDRQRAQAAAIARALERQLAAEGLFRPNDASNQPIDILQDVRYDI